MAGRGGGTVRRYKTAEGKRNSLQCVIDNPESLLLNKIYAWRSTAIHRQLYQRAVIGATQRKDL